MNPPEIIIPMHIGNKLAQYDMKGEPYPEWALLSYGIMQADLHVPCTKNIDIQKVKVFKSKESTENTYILVIQLGDDSSALELKGKVK